MNYFFHFSIFSQYFWFFYATHRLLRRSSCKSLGLQQRQNCSRGGGFCFCLGLKGGGIMSCFPYVKLFPRSVFTLPPSRTSGCGIRPCTKGGRISCVLTFCCQVRNARTRRGRSIGPTLCFFFLFYFLSKSIAQKGFCFKIPLKLGKERRKKSPDKSIFQFQTSKSMIGEIFSSEKKILPSKKHNKKGLNSISFFSFLLFWGTRRNEKNEKSALRNFLFFKKISRTCIFYIFFAIFSSCSLFFKKRKITSGWWLWGRWLLADKPPEGGSLAILFTLSFQPIFSFWIQTKNIEGEFGLIYSKGTRNPWGRRSLPIFHSENHGGISSSGVWEPFVWNVQMTEFSVRDFLLLLKKKKDNAENGNGRITKMTRPKGE